MTRPSIDPMSVCPSCLEPAWTGADCPRCGHDHRHEDQDRNALPQHTILDERYFIGLVLGYPGGFGITYRGLDLTSGKKVAIKEYMPFQLAVRSAHGQTVRPLGEKHAEYFEYGVMRFRQESEILKSLDHPIIVRVVDYFEANKTAYLVMPFVEGMTLAQYVHECGGKINFRAALNIMVRVMDALRYSHSKNLIHRDVSPENIYITENHNVILLDFGSARSPYPGLALTCIHKLGYSAPEVILGGAQGPYTDVYGVAATIHFVCTGDEVPYAADRNENSTLPMPTQKGVALPAASERALLRALSIIPTARQQSIAELQKELVPPRAWVDRRMSDSQSGESGSGTAAASTRKSISFCGVSIPIAWVFATTAIGVTFLFLFVLLARY